MKKVIFFSFGIICDGEKFLGSCKINEGEVLRVTQKGIDHLRRIPVKEIEDVCDALDESVIYDPDVDAGHCYRCDQIEQNGVINHTCAAKHVKKIKDWLNEVRA